jgi:phosphatidate cytidylyltransferase
MDEATSPKKRFSELGLRMASAAVLIPLSLAMVWYGGWWLAIGCSVAAAVMAYEWSQMSGYPHWIGFLVSTCLVCLSLPLNRPEISLGILAAGLVFTFVTANGTARNRGVVSFGLLYVTAMTASLYLLRDGPWNGLAAALLFMSFVWASDAAAYFSGRTIGGPRLAPSESPNKTWAGAIGAVVACCLCGAAASHILSASLPLWVLAGFIVSVTAQIGDLFESGLKRRFGVKDAGAILPGHGGVLDRVDGLGAVCLLATILLYAVPAIRTGLGLQSVVG